jgi:CDP-diacylglycerol---serine O-phosphatidyltransferase
MNDLKLFTIPNIFTCGNLLCGCVGIVCVFRGDSLLAGALIVLAAVFDFLDGFLARLLKQASPIGKELDSLADCVTFGVLPSTIIFNLIDKTIPDLNGLWLSYFAYILAVFSALRLAKFNVDTRQSESFIGVPTPANALLVASVPFILRYNPELEPIIVNQKVLLGYVVVMSFLLVSEIPLFALKFKSFAWSNNRIQYIFIVASVLLLVLLKFAAVPVIIFLYILLSFINNRFF